MILKSLILKNIRSYMEGTIEFPQGSVLLTGDIGSGKSTILLAIEFALFGIKSSELPGSSLLRNGKREGFVELSLEIDGKQITIRRYLKQGINGITQDAGYIIKDGLKKDATPKELRAIIFELLGYPRDLVSKNRDLVYRYTVYTPQEAMKEILYAKKEDRLDTLRKVFNVDKYKRIRENTIMVLSSLKEKRKELEGFSQNLQEKQKELQDLLQEKQTLLQQLQDLAPKLEHAKKILLQKASHLEVLEKDRQEVSSLSREVALLDSQLQAKLDQRKRNQQSIERLEKELAQLSQELLGKQVIDDQADKLLLQKKAEIQQKEKDLKLLSQKIQSLSAKKAQSQDLKEQVLGLDNCPLCKQHVSHEHKQSISTTEDKKQHDIEIILGTHLQQEQQLEQVIGQLQEEIEDLRKKQSETATLKIKHQRLEQCKKDKDEKLLDQDALKKNIGQINVKKLDLNVQLESKKSIEELYAKARQELDKARQEERALELQHTSIIKDIQSSERMEKMLHKDIAEKKVALEKVQKLKQTQYWLSEFFINLMHTMEKHVMLQINREFNELFKNWFSVLMEDEMLSVRLDDEFTPLIEQNGFETTIDNLSGGEKTSVALAYRLALNKVINDVVSEIKTKDILMLDEPTDGFSTEQLDKVREVLDMLKIRQVVMVSHEAKIESFVDKVIRVSKHDHISHIVSS